MATRTLLLLVSAAVVVLAPLGCGQASSPAEKQQKQAGVERAEPVSEPASKPARKPTTPPSDSASGTTVGKAFAEAELKPVGDSGVSGNVVFKEVGSLGVQVELAVSGLPASGDYEEDFEEPKPYFAQVHEGSCSEVPKGGQEPEDDHGDDHHGHEHGGAGPSLALLTPGPLLAKVEEHAGHAEYEAPPADELTGNVDTPLSFSASADGTAFVTSLLEGVEPEQLLSGSPKYMDVREPSHDAPTEDWPALACADLGEGD